MKPAVDCPSPELLSGGAGSAPEMPMPSRRAMLKPLAALSALWAAGASATKAAPTNQVSADVDPGAVLPKLVRRMCIGPTTADYALAESLGYDGFIAYQMDPDSIDDSALNAMLATNPTVNSAPWQLSGFGAGELTEWFAESAIVRAIYTRRQFFERMVELWRDHFNISVQKYPGVFLLPVDDRQVIRPNALGAFFNMLHASTSSAGMLAYLDNDHSVAGAVNENYARELLELHTFGVDNGYTQQDVIELARCLTGWGMDPPSSVPGSGVFRYNNALHDQGAKFLLGQAIPPNGGFTDGYNSVTRLALHPNTAEFIAKKVCTWLWGEGPPKGLLDEVKQIFLEFSGYVPAMAEAALRPNVMFDAPLKFKRPLHLIASALRVLPHTLTDPAGLRVLLSAAGHLPYNWSPPNGYPDKISHWTGLVVNRWNFAFKMVDGSIAGLSVDFAGFLSGQTTAEQVMNHIDQQFFAGEMGAVDKNAIRDYLAVDPSSAQRRAEAVALSICSPSFQWY